MADPGGRVRLSGQYSRSAPVSTVPPPRTILDDVSVAVDSLGRNLRWFLLDVRQYGRKRLWLRTLVDGSVLMMLLDYTCIRALCGCQMMVCL